jgi:hypothetical protein
MVCTVQAQMWSVSFIKTGSTEQTDFIFVWYSAANNDLQAELI